MDQMIKVATVTLAPGEAKPVEFQFSPMEARVYQVSVDGLIGSFSVIEAPPPLIEIIQMPLNVSVSFEPHYYYQGAFLLWQGGTLTVHASNPDSRFRDWEYDEESPGGAVGCMKDSRSYSPLIGYFHPAELARGGSESWDINLKGGSYPQGTRLIVEVSFQTRFTRGTEVIILKGLGKSPSITLTT